ncbi:MAG TPA: hypothetical protein DD658_01870 [Deltaproteobacteria bacterium]|nr:MAG: hypothetical protein A2X88_00930 [Deltaproteobacteria bacterium GWC2_65_14]HBO68941.1 hypothetical protein [Deltaproteobacteria bacterium]
MKVPKKLAILGFNLCASVFIGLCVYGLLLHFEEGMERGGSILSSVLSALIILGAIAGIGYFGNQWDRRNTEEARDKSR